MSKAVADKLTTVIKAVQALPEDSQETIVRVSDFSEPHMTERQRAEVKRRLALPRRYVPEERVRKILRKYNPLL